MDATTKTSSPEAVSAGLRVSHSRIARNAIINLLGEGWIFVVLLVAMPYLIRKMGEDGFGLFSLAWVIISYLLFLDIGVSRAATKFVSEYLAAGELQRTKDVVHSAIVGNLILGLSAALLTIAAMPWLVELFKIPSLLRHDSRLVFYAIAVAVPTLLLQAVFRAVLNSLQRFGSINVINAVSGTAQWAFACALAARGGGVGVIVIAAVAVRVVATVFYAIVLRQAAPHLREGSRFHPAVLKELMKFGGWVTVSQVISPVLVYLDRAMIAGFLSLAAVAIYTVPNEITTRLRIIPASVVSTLYPAFSERCAGETPDLGRLYAASVRYLLLLLVPCFSLLVLLGPDILSLWMGKDFAAKGGAILQIMSVGAFLNCMAYIPYSLLQAAGRPDLTGKFHLLEVPLYVVLCLLLIPKFGILGAAVSGTIRYAVDAALLFVSGQRVKKLANLWAPSMLRAFLVACFSMFASALIYLVPSPGRTRWLAAAVMLACYIPLTWRFALESEDRPAILRLMNFVKQTA